jgi:hypothetical protein
MVLGASVFVELTPTMWRFATSTSFLSGEVGTPVWCAHRRIGWCLCGDWPPSWRHTPSTCTYFPLEGTTRNIMRVSYSISLLFSTPLLALYLFILLYACLYTIASYRIIYLLKHSPLPSRRAIKLENGRNLCSAYPPLYSLYLPIQLVSEPSLLFGLNR